MFDKSLFLSLCDKYNVELSATNTEPMVRNKDGTYDSLSDRMKKEFDDFFNEYNKENRVPIDRIVDKLSKLELTSIETVNDEEDIS